MVLDRTDLGERERDGLVITYLGSRSHSLLVTWTFMASAERNSCCQVSDWSMGAVGWEHRC